MGAWYKLKFALDTLQFGFETACWQTYGVNVLETIWEAERCYFC